MGKKLYIVDGHAHIYSAYYAPMRQRLVSSSGEPTKATYVFTNILLGLIEKYRPDMLVVAMDSKGETFRKKIYAEYKAHRAPMPDDMPVQIDRIEQILGAMNIPMIRMDGFEADDIIGTLARKAEKEGIETYICSKDKDFLQLLDDGIRMLDLRTSKITDPETMFSEMNVTPEQFVDVLALQGDTADNVPGVADIGPKTALEWIQKYGSLDNLYEHTDEIKGKRGDNLRSSKAKAYLSKKLVTIDCVVPVELDTEGFALCEPDREKLVKIFGELGFTRLLSQMGFSGTTEEQISSGEEIIESGAGSAKTVKHDYKLIDTAEKFDEFMSELKGRKLFAIDTETTSVDAMRAELVGMSFSWAEYSGYYLPIKAPLGTKHLDLKIVRQAIGGILADRNIRKIGQNIKYDMLILRNAGMPLRGIFFDTMVASYCLETERRSHSMDAMAADFLGYECIPISALIGKGKNQLTFDLVDTAIAGEYAAEDADVTYRLFKYLADKLEKEPVIRKLFEEVEMPLVSVLAAMEYNGVSLDTKLLREMGGELRVELEKLSEQIFAEAGEHFNIDSPKQLAEIFFDKLKLQSVRSTKSGRSTDAEVLEQLASEHPIVEFVQQYRQLNKLQNTYVDKLGSLINSRTGRVHASFNQTITATGRLSSSNPNLQNIPIRTELGKRIREAFVPGLEDYYILSADYSQIELRLLAHFSRDRALMEAFEKDQDIHSFVASQIYGVAIGEVSREMRSSCKAVNFGIIYGQGSFGLSRSIGISVGEAKKFIDDYFKRYSSIKKFMDETVNKARQTGYAETIMGRRRRISDLNSKNGAKRSLGERLAVNTVIQGSAADLIKVAMINIQREIEERELSMKMILQIHDELVFEVPVGEAQRDSQWISEKMTGAIELAVPLKVDVAMGVNWSK